MSISFGTDGIRATAGIEPLTPQTLFRIGNAIAQSVGFQSLVVIGKDTRESGDWISEALSKGIIAAGSHVRFGGVMPTAAVSCATIGEKAQRGIMVTASHNPFYDNGIKIFSSSGHKLQHKEQEQLQEFLTQDLHHIEGGTYQTSDLTQHWRNRLPQPDLTGMKILLDCAHGAAAPHAPKILEELGAAITRQGCSPNGKNINASVGALHPPKDITGHDLAICFDGDADRLMLVDSQNRILDGDDILWMLHKYYTGPLVGTVMSNGGLEEALQGRLKRSPVGDSNVEALMKSCGASLGAEPSGHVLFADGLPTGDGLYTILRILECIGKSPLSSSWIRWPVCKENIRFHTRIDLDSLDSIKIAQDSGQRVIVRYSGTEPLLRIMVEGKEANRHLVHIREEFLEKSK